MKISRGVKLWCFTGLFLYTGLSLLFYGWTNLTQASESAGWQTVEGKVLVSEVVYDPGGPRAGSAFAYKPNVQFQYLVDGRIYRSKKFSFGQSTFAKRSSAEKIANRYPGGSTVDVWYKPQEPGIAVLEPGGGWTTSFVLLGVGVVFAMIGISCLRKAIYRPTV
jgi:hypothetical protein